MLKKSFLLLLLVLGCVLPAAANQPLVVKRCAMAAPNSGPTASVLSCNLANTTSGNKIIVEFAGSMTGDTISSTETLTCPAGATIQHHYAADKRTAECYVDTASSHATFAVSVTATGGFTQMNTLVVKEVQGLAAGDDSGSESSVAGTTMTVTTANTNEWLEAVCTDYANDLVPGTGFTQLEWVAASAFGSQDYRGLTEKQITTTATGYTTACTFTNSLPAPEIAAIAYQQSSPPATPAVNILQAAFTTGNSAGSNILALHNTTSGSKIVMMGLINVSGAFNTITGTCTESCTFPASALAERSISTSFFTLGTGYGDTTTTHAIYTASIQTSGGSGGNEQSFVYEVAGLNSGIDAGSEAEATAQSVSYTTAAANEWTFCAATDNAANPMSPASSFLQWGQGPQPAVTNMAQGLTMAKVSVSSGSNTCSYTQTGSSTPLISTISFVQNIPPFSGYPMVIKYRVRPRKIPWDRPRRQMLLERI